jgi:hypothetical protein
MQIRVVLTILILASFTSEFYAQSLDPNYALKRAIYDGDKYIKFHILDPDVHIRKLDSDKFYTWTKSQKIQTTQGGASGDLLNGLYSSFYKNNQLEEQGEYKRGLKHGKWIKWNDDGIIIWECRFRKGKKIGRELNYNNEGALIFERKYFGRTIRTQKEDSVIIQRGSELTVIVFGEDGSKEQVIQTKGSKLHGKQFERLTDSSTYISRYRLGEQVWEKEKVEKHPVRDLWNRIKPKKNEKRVKEKKPKHSKKENKSKAKKEGEGEEK